MREFDQERQLRSFAFVLREDEEKGFYAEGYPIVFEQPTVLFEDGGIEYREVIDRHALDETDMEDVIFNYDHKGKIMARTRNGTLWLTVDEKGLFARMRLDGTQAGREMYEEIKKGYVDRMSFQFSIDPAYDDYDPKAHMWTIRKIKRLYDVSAVSFPAYEQTSLDARKRAAQEIEDRRRDQAEEQKRMQELRRSIKEKLERKEA